jgi:perosamine synthetase
MDSAMNTSFNEAHVLVRLRDMLPPQRPIALHEPRFAGREWEYVKSCLDSGWVSSAGPFVQRFEAMLAERLQVRHAVAVVNGTAALHTTLLLVGVRPGDEVLVPSLTFVATANAVSYCGATPHFVDSAMSTLGLDPAALDRYLGAAAVMRGDEPYNRSTGRRLAAVVPMHVFGHPVDMDALAEVARRWRLPVVEDAAEALGSFYRERPAGSLGRVAALSFNGNKIVTTGGGGAIATDDSDMAAAARHLTTTAKLPHAWAFEHDRIGFNYRLPNINAALGCAQLEQLDGFIAAKRGLAARYRESLAGLDGVTFVAEPAHCRSIYWLNAILVPDAAARDRLLAASHGESLLTRPAWTPMHRLPMYRDCPKAPLPVAEAIADRLVSLPSSAVLAGDRP